MSVVINGTTGISSTGPIQGPIQGTTGSFSGALSGTTGNFSGELDVPAAQVGGATLQASQTVGRNVVVNGGCEVSQVNGTTLITPVNGGYSLDNVRWVLGAASKLQSQQVNALLSLGATHAETISVLAQYSPAASESFFKLYPIEGLNFARFQYGTANAKAGSLQFKARASVAGTYSGSIQSYNQGRSYPFSFTLAANTDTLIKIENIPGDTAGGTWVGATNQGAAFVTFDFGSGTNLKSTAGTWQTGNYDGVTGSTNLVSQVVGSTLTITDVQFEVGSFCTAFERKLYDQVLRECKRYLPVFSWVSGDYITGGFVNTAVELRVLFPFSVQTRASCTGLVQSGSNIANVMWPQNSGGGFTSFGAVVVPGSNGVQVNVPVSSAPVGYGVQILGSANGYIYFTGAQI
jgi:hypothetical protein